jgi:hypothetical protein
MMPEPYNPAQPVRPPRVAFEVRAREAGVVDGKMTYKDVDFVIVTPPGQYSAWEGEAQPWIDSQRREPYHDQLVRAYEAFKAGKEPPLDGTPIEMCTLFTPSQIKQMKLVGIRAVEDMAAWPDGQLQMLGMGAVRLKQTAQNWLKSAKDAGAAAGEIDKLKAELETQKADNDQLRDQLRALAARVEAVEGPRQKLGLKGSAA